MWLPLYFIVIGLAASLNFNSASDAHEESLINNQQFKVRHFRHSRAPAASAHGPSPDFGDEYSQGYYTGNSNSLGNDRINEYYSNNNSIVGQSSLRVADNRKPVFRNCASYHPSVKEEQPTGTFIIQVEAVDEDPPEVGGTITYSFVTSSKLVSIEPNTGTITTKAMLDWDEPKREKEIYVTVRATDNGKPRLDDTCTFKITVEDINDNSPAFDKTSYEESVPQDLKIGDEVMRLSATDIDNGSNSVIVYSLMEKGSPSDVKYFRVQNTTGIVYLNKLIDKQPGYKFKFKASATDQGLNEPHSTDVDVIVLVVESDKKPPQFTRIPTSPIHVAENFSNFSYNIATFEAKSNTDEGEAVFSLAVGPTEQTNKHGTFRLSFGKNMAHLRLAGNLDYERIERYDLTVRITNKYKLGAVHSLTIMVDDVNDNFPKFTKDLTVGGVSENQPPGTPVMQVNAVDDDKTPSFSKITYILEDNTENFDIDPNTGNITTKQTFDRETKDTYNVKVSAIDGAPSSHSDNGEPNKATQVFSIEIIDMNDHSPIFTKRKYEADISEDAGTNQLVTEVKADDEDSASSIIYSIKSGNVNDAFFIEPETGKIKVKSGLDYEKITEYVLKVEAFDGLYRDESEVEIRILNVNDNPPAFLEFQRETTIQEETLVPGCLLTVRAFDPDISNRNAPQNIVYSLVNEHLQKYFSIDKDGCLSLIKPLDREPPNGNEKWQVYIRASDDGGPGVNKNSLSSAAELVINLIDINDNAPTLNMGADYVRWDENQNPGFIVKLIATDKDGPANGPPFTFELSPDADADIRAKFSVQNGDLFAEVRFDREEQKEYLIPIKITDSGSPPQSGVDTLKVVIGDVNDNPAKEGSSSIFVYLFEGAATDTDIGRVYVEDPDDWDLDDKYFEWKQYIDGFSLNAHTGMITMNHGLPGKSYLLYFKVTEEPKSTGLFAKHSVSATVNVTIKTIPEEAVDKSGSIRFEGVTAEEFVTKNPNGESKADILRSQLAQILNNTEDNIDVFTILHSPINNNNTSLHLDVRFSAHGSPYYEPERINSAIVNNQDDVERALDLRMLMINVDECMVESILCEAACVNELKKSNVSAAVFTNTTSFIGINAYVQPVCDCRPSSRSDCRNAAIAAATTPLNTGGSEVRKLPADTCVPAVGFDGKGWALYPPFEACSNAHITLYVRALQKDSLIFYVGPDSMRPSAIGVEDFMSLELRKGYPVLLVNYGTGTTKVEHSYKQIVDNMVHKIEIILTTTSIELIVDDCKLQKCMGLSTPVGTNKFLNVNGPLQLGGTYMDLTHISLQRNWTHKPFALGFEGCIQNFTFNDKLYNLGMPSLSKSSVDVGCNNIVAESITFKFDWTFLAAILICLVILTILLMAVAVHRRKVEDMYKDTDDIRENIINYEDEGGGEGDMTGYDLTVLRLQDYDPIGDDKYMNRMLPSTGMDEVPDICGFLDGKKHAVDNDPETLPFDDVRHYAYEGDGNTTGSLSSLASGTDEGDLNFDYLSNFGPRFRKLADMYGEDASDEDSDTYHNTASVSWC
ncbi:DE-cadherin isoform X2 [Planococcus citri]|uniref:DE-cadherin isoform X2 n=1 Tax=Planococcus citri TaxID=170843 RepID=UPI0031F7BC19